VRDLSCGDTRVCLEFEVRRILCRCCGKVKRERLDFLADNPFYTKRFTWHAGRRCRASSIKDVAEELHLDWHAVKELDKQYKVAQLERTGVPGPKAIGIEEISIRKRHTYRIVVSDMWKPFRTVTARRAPQAAILFDKFHVMRHLNDALDLIMKSEYGRLQGKDRRYIKG
jgi:transposase